MFDHLDSFFTKYENFDFPSDPYLGVVLVRTNTGSEIVINQETAVEIMTERYSNPKFKGSYYQPCSEHSWKAFVAEFFPGWTIESFVV
jgi:hypothetical protein